MGVFSGIGRIWRALLAGLGFKVNSAADALNLNPAVMAGSYDKIIADKKSHINQFMDAIAGQVALQEGKKQTLANLTAQVEKNEKLKAGASAMAKKVVEKYGGDQEKCKADPDFVKCQAAFRDFTTTGEQLHKRVDELESDIAASTKLVNNNKAQIQSLMRDLDQIKTEKGDAVADVISAKEQKKISDVMAGISEDKTAGELQGLRDLRNKAKASAKVSTELSGLDAKSQENDFLAAVESSSANNEFDALMGFKATAAPVTSSAVADASTKLPEA